MLEEALLAGSPMLHAAAALAWVPLPPLGPESIPGQLSGFLYYLLAVFLLRLDFHSRVHRAFALFLVFRGVLNTIGPFRFLPESGWYWEAVYPYIAIGLPAAAFNFALVYRDPQGRSRPLRLAGWALLGVALVAELAYAVDHSWWAWVRPPPLDGLHPLRFLAYGGIGLLFAVEFARAAPGPVRTGLLLVAVSFTLHTASYVPARWAGYGDASWVDGLVLLATLAVYVRLAAQRRDGDLARGARAAALAIAGIAVLAYAAELGNAAGLGWARTIEGYLQSGTTLAQPLLVTYALVRHRLFDIDLRIKGTVRQSTVVAAFIGTYLVAAQLAQVVWGASAGPFVGIAVAGLLGLGIRPLQRAADHFANAAMPTVDDSPAYLNLRKLEVYRAALEQALASGAGSAAEPRLAALRSRLGLTERDHAVLLHALRSDTTTALVMDLAPGSRVLGRYRVDRFLGEGAHGRTYLARDEGDRAVVLKALRLDRGGTSLAREARAIAAVRHPAVVELREVHEDGATTLLAMEYVAGGSLRERLGRGALAPAEFRRVAADLLDALGAVHAAGIVHRDVKPSNVLLTPEGRAKLADFGIAHLPGLETTVGGADGSAMGTIPYMSPEQAKGKPVTPRSDLFSAAATLYEAWTGAAYLVPGPRESSIELQMRAASAGPFKGRLEGPRALRGWYAKALDPTPSRRFADAAEMRAALLAALPAPRAEPFTKG